MITKQNLKEILKNNVISISFTKVDGSKREMKCTLKEELLPELQVSSSLSKKQENEHVLPVWDLEKNSFRSFRIDSVLDYSVLA